MTTLPRSFLDLAAREFDVLVIGGGINGTGVARDAARRGLSVALVEKEDFGYGTTGRSTRLIHGGLRYLAMFDFGLVRESLREREVLLRNAPHLVRPLTFLIPFYEGQRTAPWKVKIGLRLYDFLKGKSIIPSHRALRRDEILALEPGLREEGLRGGALYGDGQVEMVERLCVENALDAAAHGATIVNHTIVTQIEGNNVSVRDALTGETCAIRAKAIVNTSGPWLDRVPGLGHVKSRMTKGTHFVGPLATKHAILLFSPDDDRVFFSIPWLGQQLVGTTDTDVTVAPDDVTANKQDVEYLQRGIRFVLPRADTTTIHYAYAGIRNLVPEEGRSESDVSRKHQILVHDNHPELVSLVGGKITPYRAVCEELVNIVAPQARASDTATARLPGAPDDYAELERQVGTTLAMTYGERAKLIGPLGAQICAHAPLHEKEVEFVIQTEMARTAADVLLRRTRSGWEACEGRDALPRVLDVLDRMLGRTAEERKADEAAYLTEIGKRHAFECA